MSKFEVTKLKYNCDYERFIAMLFILREAINKYRFKSNINIEKAEKYDNHLFIYQKEKNTLEVNNITVEKYNESNQLLKSEHSDFDLQLVRYFFSYKDLVRENSFIHSDLMLYPNYFLHKDFDLNESLESIELNPNFDKFGHLVESIIGEDPKRYKFKHQIIQHIKSKVNDYNVTRLIQSLNNCFSGKKTFQDLEYVIKPYWKFLTEKVLDIEKKSLREDFLNLNKKFMSKESKLFFKKLIDEFSRKNDGQSKKNCYSKKVKNSIKKLDRKSKRQEEEEIIIRCLNEKVKHIDYPTWISDDENKFDNIIKEDEIEDFLKIFVYTISQPHQNELKKMIKADILEDHSRKYNGDSFYTENQIDRYVEEILHSFCTEVVKWKNDHKKSNNKNYFKYKWNEFKFNVQQPDTYFNERAEELKVLHEIIQKESKIRVICGYSGMGKTELILKYIQRYGQQFENQILWIDGKSQQSIFNCFLKVAEMLKISTVKPDGESENIRNIVTEIYKAFQLKKCLIVFDDVASREVLESYIPKQTNNDFMFIIITSNSNWDCKQKMDLNVLTEKNAMNLMTNRLNNKEILDLKYIERIVNILECFPLAVKQAASYIVKELQNNSGFRIEQCDESFFENAKKSRELDLLKNLSSYETKVFISFQTIINSIAKFKGIGAKAFEILSILSFMAPNNIDVKWFSMYSKTDLEEIFQLLKDYSLIKIEAGILSIHKLVQMVTRITLKQKNIESAVIESVLNFFIDCFPIGNSRDNLKSVSKLIFHIESCLTYMNLCNSLPEELNEKATTISNIPFNYLNRETINRMNKTFLKEKILILLKNKCGSELIKIFDKTLNDIIKQRYKDILTDFIEFNSGNHIKYGDLLVKIGDAEFFNGNNNDAKLLFEKALFEYLNLGAKNVTVANIYKKLGSIESNLENHSIAKIHFEKSLSLYLSHYKESHIVVGKLRLNLGSLEIRLGNFKEAKVHNKCALDIFLSSKEKDYIDIAKTYRNLGVIEIQFGNNTLAKNHLEMALGGFWAYYGMEHKIVLEIYRNLGLIETRLGNYTAARILYENILPLYLKYFGENDIRVAEVYMGLGLVEVAVKNLKIAKTLYEKALGIYLSHYGGLNLDVAKTCVKLGKLELFLGNCNVAKSHFEVALSGFLKCNEQVQLGELYNLLGTVELRLGNIVLTKDYIKQALSTYLKNYGIEHKEVARAYSILCRLP